MRYLQVPTVPFRAPDGRTVAVRSRRELEPGGSATLKVKVMEGASLDEVVTRPEVYGSGSEGDAYRLFDENVVEIMQSRYTLKGVGELRVP